MILITVSLRLRLLTKKDDLLHLLLLNTLKNL